MEIESTIQTPKSKLNALIWVATPTHELKSERHEAHHPRTHWPPAGGGLALHHRESAINIGARPPCPSKALAGSNRRARRAMSGTPDAGSDSQGFTCSALLMCLYLPGLSKKKPGEAEAAPKEPTPAEHAVPPDAAPRRAASLECASLNSGNNIVFDFAVGDQRPEEQGGARAIHGYCPSPCFDLPVELIRAGERFAADSDAPVTAAFVFGDGGQRGGALQRMASCLAPGGVEGSGEPLAPHLVRFLSASGRSTVARPPVMVMPPPRRAAG